MKKINVSLSVLADDRFVDAAALEQFLREQMAVDAIEFLSEREELVGSDGFASTVETVYLGDQGSEMGQSERFIVEFSGPTAPTAEKVKFALSFMGDVGVQPYKVQRADSAPGNGPELINTYGGQVVFSEQLVDWTVSEGSCEDEDIASKVYLGKVVARNNSLDIEISPLGESTDGKPFLGLYFEINGGLPCVHVTNRQHGDMLFSIFSHQDAVYVRGDEAEYVKSPREHVSASFDQIKINHSSVYNQSKDVVFIPAALN